MAASNEQIYRCTSRHAVLTFKWTPDTILHCEDRQCFNETVHLSAREANLPLKSRLRLLMWSCPPLLLNVHRFY